MSLRNEVEKDDYSHAPVEGIQTFGYELSELHEHLYMIMTYLIIIKTMAHYKHGTFLVNTNTVLAFNTNTVLEFLLVQV